MNILKDVEDRLLELYSESEQYEKLQSLEKKILEWSYNNEIHKEVFRMSRKPRVRYNLSDLTGQKAPLYRR